MIVENLVLASEQYGIAARKGSGLTKMINKALVELAKTGAVDAIADAYGVKSEICIDKTATFGDLTDSEKADWEYIKGNGKFIVGYTLFAPIAYEDGDQLVGFDIDLAKAVAQYLELDVEFQIIEWATKEAKLEAKTIDCIWNGMTITDAIEAAADCTAPYMYNTQVAVIKKADADKYKTLADLAGVNIAAEAGSAGEKVISSTESIAGGLKSVTAQTDALLEVLSGASEAAIVDLTLAKALIKN